MEESFNLGGFDHMAAGFIAGALIFTLINKLLSIYVAKHRKRSGEN